MFNWKAFVWVGSGAAMIAFAYHGLNGSVPSWNVFRFVMWFTVIMWSLNILGLSMINKHNPKIHPSVNTTVEAVYDIWLACFLAYHGAFFYAIMSILSMFLEQSFWAMNKELKESETKTVSPLAQTRFMDFDEIEHPCNKWWEDHGRYMMSGGGRREFIWACRGWIAREQLAEGVEVTGEA